MKRSRKVWALSAVQDNFAFDDMSAAGTASTVCLYTGLHTVPELAYFEQYTGNADDVFSPFPFFFPSSIFRSWGSIQLYCKAEGLKGRP